MQQGDPSETADVSTARKVAWLASPAAWPGAPAPVTTIETNMSWVFLAGERVRKLKKPIRTAVLDFRTLAAREANCRAEVRLNRRLAPTVYLGHRPLLLSGADELCLEGPGSIVDWLVCMRRLDEERMLDRMIEARMVCDADVDALAAVFARFYGQLDAVEMSIEERLRGLRAQHELDRAMLERDDFDLPDDVVSSVCEAIGRIIRTPPEWLLARARERRIVEGHGDLRLEHVCLTRPPVIIDCLEFEPSLRLVDPFEELARLRMECERLDARWIGDGLIERCARTLHDRAPTELLAFHAAMQACLRARFALQHLLRPPIRDPGRWLPQAHRYVALAERSVAELAASAAVR